MNLVDPVLTFYFTREDCSFGPGKNLRYGGMRPTPAMIASSALKMRYGSAVDVSAVTDIQDEHFPRFVVCLVDSPVIAYSDSPAVLASELARSRWTRFIREGLKTCLDAILDVRGEPGYPFLRSSLDDYGIAHQPPVTFPSLISRIACSRGMAASPSLSISAFASS